MDVSILRIILIILGGGLILGIYLWERHKRANERVHAVRRFQDQRLEPTFGAGGDREPETPDEGEGGLDDALHELEELVSEEQPARVAAAQPVKKRGRIERTHSPAEIRQQELFADDSITDTDHHKHSDQVIPVLILQINVVARDDGFEGMDIVRAIQGERMEIGDMHIFHRHDEAQRKGTVLFSMASMVKPGTFPLESMEDFKTPGLALFAQLPGPLDGLELFSEMLATAEHLAAELGGELQDETHSRLTKQTVEHLRSQILEHRRQVQLAKSTLKKPPVAQQVQVSIQV